MGPAYFVIAIFGCGDGAVGCRTVAAPAAHYATEQACLSARADVLTANNDLDFPTLLARCQPVNRKASSGERAPEPGTAAVI